MSLRNVATIALFLIGLVVLDRAVGIGLRALSEGVRTGEQFGLVQRALEERDRDVIAFGSSRTKRHVDPEVIEAQTGLRAYNAGVLGQGLPYARMLEALMLARGTDAKLFVLQLDPVELYADRSDRASMFNVFHGELEPVDRILEGRDRFARLKLLSHAYRYNSLALSLLRHRLAPPQGNPLGFEPRRDRLDPAERGPDPSSGYAIGEPLPEMEALLHDFLRDAREAGIACLVTITPRYRAGRPAEGWERDGLARIERIAHEEGARFVPLDERTLPFTDPDLFADRAHLNERGAALFSAQLAEEIRRILAR